LLAEVEDCNQKAMVIKKVKEREEKDLDNKIVEYNRIKAMREEELVAEHRRLRDEKEKELQKLRDLQERESDRQAEQDEIKAKRAWEEAERK